MNLDNLTYTELREGLAKLPATWYPDLIRVMVEAALDKKVFEPHGATTLVAKVEWAHTAPRVCPTCKPKP